MRNLCSFLFLLILLAGCHTPREEWIVETPYRPVPPSRLIVIDPGHGGEDFGTHSLSKPRYEEKYLNMTTSLMLRDILHEMGYETVLTRTDDTFIPLSERAIFANMRSPLLFVSVHYNSAPSKEAKGIEVYYYQSEADLKRTEKSKRLASFVLDKVIAGTQAKSRGVKHGNFAVIRETRMPAILIEGGFLTNYDEMQKIKNPDYLKALAFGIAQGIDRYVKEAKLN